MITPERLREVLHYDPDTGVFAWLVSTSRRCKVGDIAGSVRESGHIVIRVDGRLYRAHQLAFLYMTGRWVSGVPDHIDGVPRNNRFSNLRDATYAMNSQNTRMLHPMMGIEVRLQNPLPYRARIKIQRKLRTIGSFKTAEEAQAAYLKAKRELHPGWTL